MSKMKSEKPEEAWTYEKIREVYGDDENKDMLKLVLVCGNCEHKDILKNFREHSFAEKNQPIKKPFIKPWSPDTPLPYVWRNKDNLPLKTISKTNDKTGMSLSLTSAALAGKTSSFYNDCFVCPKCGSSYVYPLNKEQIIEAAI